MFVSSLNESNTEIRNTFYGEIAEDESKFEDRNISFVEIIFENPNFEVKNTPYSESVIEQLEADRSGSSSNTDAVPSTYGTTLKYWQEPIGSHFALKNILPIRRQYHINLRGVIINRIHVTSHLTVNAN